MVQSRQLLLKGLLDRLASVGRFHMNPSATAIFDLIPSEKLQLGEDPWDDLASTPEAVPVFDWQKRELARRKANLLNNPALGLAWEDVKQRARSIRRRRRAR
jgi:putative addiction module component (TIGR02574 family)